MRVAVVGSGAVGGYFGAKLAQGGQDVTFIARGAHLAAMRQHGLRIQSAKLGDFTVHAPAVDDPAEIGHVDLVLFTVKAYDNQTALNLLGLLQVFEPVAAPVVQFSAYGQVGSHRFSSRSREQHLAAVTGRQQTGDTVQAGAKVVPVPQLGVTGVQRHADP